MAQSTRTFRIFVSSTFSDLKAERNALQERVFPRLRELAMAHGCRFQAIDLRWGVSEEAAVNQKTMKICLGEIERCQDVSPRPNFIILLGNRYGWRPLPYEIPALEYEQIISFTSEQDKSLLDQWYLRDENATPQIYVLKVRTGEYLDYEAFWHPVEVQLHNVLETAARRANLPAAAMVKYIASATEQEIRLGALEMAGDRSHIFCYSRETRNIPQDDTGRDYLDFDQDLLDKPVTKKLVELKADLKKVLGENYHEYEAVWEASAPSPGHIAQLCEHVYKDLETVIISEINQLIDISPLEHEINEQASFAAARRADFIGRMDYLEMLVEYQKIPNAQPLLLVGASGTGKSALMAEAIKRLEESGSGVNILYRFIGATPSSSNPASVRESICQQIYDLYDLERVKMNRLKEIVKIGRQADEQRQQIINEYVMTDRSALERYLRKHITGKPLILYIDALDQFSTIGGEAPFGWLPTELPELVHLVTSSTPGSHIEALLEKLSGENVIEVKPLAIEDGETILDAWLSGRNRTLQANQKKALLKGFSGGGLPLYLKMAFEEACQWRSYEAPPDLSKDLPGLIRQFFARLAQESNHGRNLVERSLAYLAAAKNGLAEDELLDILSHDIGVYRSFLEKMRHVPGDLARAVIAYLGEKNCAKHKVGDASSAEAWYETKIKPDAIEFQKFLEYLTQMPDSPRLPVVLWSRMHFDLKPYLLQRDADGSLLYNYYHRLFGEVATTDYLQSEQGISRHLDLARYFHQSPIRITREGRRTLNKRKMAELLHHQTLAETWADLEHNLTDILFIEGMFEAGLGTELCDEYKLLRQMGLFPCETGQPREIIVTACEDGERFGMQCPHCLGISRISPTAVGEMTDCPQCGKKLKLSDTWRSLPWKEQPAKRRYQENAQERSTPFTQDLVEFAAFVEAEAGHLSSFPTMTLQQAINQLDLSMPAQKARAYIGTGKCEFAWCEHLNKPRSFDTILPEMPESIHFSSDGKTWLRLDGGDVVLYQAGSNEIASRFHTGDRPITAVCFSADSEYVLAGFDNGELGRIQIASDEMVFLEARHDQAIQFLQASWDGSRVLSCGQDGSISLTLVDTGEKIGEMAIHSEPIACSFSADEKQAIIIGKETGLWFFSLLDGSLMEHIPSDEPVSAATFSPDMQWLALASKSTVGIWTLQTRKKVQEIPQLHRSIEACAFSPDGVFLVVAEESINLSVYSTSNWERYACESRYNLLRTGPAVVRLSPDGQLLSYGGYFFDFNQILSLHDHPVEMQFFSAFTTSPLKYTLSGQEILAASTDVMGLLDSQSGKVLRYLPGHNASCMALLKGGDVLIAKGPALSRWANFGQEIQKHDEFTDFEGRISWVEAGENYLLAVLENSAAYLFSNDLGDSIELTGYSGHLTAAVFSASEETLITASEDGNFQVWDTGDNLPIKTLAEQGYITRKLLLSPDGLTGLAYGDDRAVHVWAAENGAEIGRTKIPEGDMLALGYANEGDQIIAISSKGILYRWDARLEEQPSLSRLSIDKLTAAVFSPRGNRCLFGTDTRELVFWDIEKNQCIRRIGKNPTCAASCLASEEAVLVGYEDTSIQFYDWDRELGLFVGGFGRASGCDLTYDLMAVSSGEQTIVMDQKNGEILAILPSATACAFSEDCRDLLTGNFDGLIQAWQLGDLQDWVLTRNRDDDEDRPPEVSDGIEFRPWSEEQVYTIACSPDGIQIMASVGSDIRLISQADPDSNDELPMSGANCFYSRDGKYIIVVSGGDTQIFNTRTRRLFKRIPGGTHISGITRDNKWIINGDRADEICLWSVQAEKEVIRIFTDDWPLSLAISPEKDEFASVGVDGILRIMRYHIPASVEKALQEERVIQKKEAREAEESKERKIAALLNGGGTLLNQGKFDEAITTFQIMGRIAREISDMENLWQAIYHESLACYRKGDTSNALDRLKEAGQELFLGEKITLDKAIMFLDLQATIMKALKDFNGACQKYQKKENLCSEGGDFPGAIQALLEQIDLGKSSVKWDELYGMYLRLVSYCRMAGDQSRLQASLGALGEILQSRGFTSFTEKTLVYYEEQMQICRELGEKDSLLKVLMQIARIQQEKGNQEAALKQYEEAEKICRELGKGSENLTCLNNQGLIYKSKGDFQKAVELYREAESIARQSNDRANLLISISQLAINQSSLGKLEAALQANLEAAELARELGNMDVLSSVLSQLGSLYEKIGELDKALATFQEEETICKSLKKYETQAICMKSQANIYLKKKNRRMATEIAYAALLLARLHKLKATEKEIQVFFRKI